MRRIVGYCHFGVKKQGSHLILTRFQPGENEWFLMFEPFQRFLILSAEGKPLKRFLEMRSLPLITRLKPGENEIELLLMLFVLYSKSQFK